MDEKPNLDSLERDAVAGKLDWRDAHALVSYARRLERELAEVRSGREAYAWESTTPVFIKYVSDERYRKFSPAVQRWYRPITQPV